MSSLEGVPLKLPPGALQEAKAEDLFTAPELTVPDYLTVLQETEYEFSLEKWVLTGLEGGFLHQPRPSVPLSSSTVPASCPPYWLMFSSPQESRLASRHSSDFWEPNPRHRSNSLNPASLHRRPRFTVSDSEDDGEVSAKRTEAGTASPERAPIKRDPIPALPQQTTRKAQRAFKPSLLNPPACLSSLPHQRRKNLRQCSLSVLETSSQERSEANPSRGQQSPASAVHRPLRPRANTIDRICSTKQHRPTHPTPKSPSLVSHGSTLDSSVELLSALSPEERELLRAITDRGYSLRTAFMALQKTGQQPPEQILSYLVAWEHLCQLGYDGALVEEALEMFQNCETKAEEFLHLLGQFNEMGFKQSTIKEVLLVHENHRERALEELMMHVA